MSKGKKWAGKEVEIACSVQFLRGGGGCGCGRGCGCCSCRCSSFIFWRRSSRESRTLSGNRILRPELGKVYTKHAGKLTLIEARWKLLGSGQRSSSRASS